MARSLLKESGQLSQKEFSFVIKKEEEDDFGKKRIKQEEKGFSQGDRIVFTRNNYGLGVKNGSMGTIQDLNKQKVFVKLDEGKEVSFAPNLNPYFDQGWAITIHKSQGTTVDRSYVLASSSMTRNLSYVAMTRHREDVQVFGSSSEFQSPEQFSQKLSKSGEKLGAADYLDTESLNKLMQKEDHLLTQIFNRVSNELEAMGVVSKRAFWHVADHFLATQKSQDIRVDPQTLKTSLREEARAEELFQQKQKGTPDISPSSPNKMSLSLEAVLEEMKHPAFAKATIVKHAFEKGLKLYGEERALAYWESKKEAFVQSYQRTLTKVETELNSPLLNRLTGQWKDQAKEVAKGDLIRVLNLIHRLKNDEIKRCEKISSEAAQEQRIKDTLKERQVKHDHMKGIHLQFKETYNLVKEYPTARSLYKEDLKELGQKLFQDKTFMETLKALDSKEAKLIERMAQGKSLQEQERIHHSLDRGRGGISL